MGRHRLYKGTYSKAPENPKTEDERQAFYKQRINVPRFNDLYIAKDENSGPDQSSQDAFDSFVERVKSGGIFEESVPDLSYRKPLAVNSFLVNSTIGSTSHTSANDTFDRLVGPRTTQSCQVMVGQSSSSGSSLDYSGVLFKSILSNAPALDSYCVEHTGLKSVPEGQEDNEGETDNIHLKVTPYNSPKQPSQKETPVIFTKPQMAQSPQLFSSNELLDITDIENATEQSAGGQQSPKIYKTTTAMGNTKSLQIGKGKSKDGAVNAVSSPIVTSKDKIDGNVLSKRNKNETSVKKSVNLVGCIRKIAGIQLSEASDPSSFTPLIQKFFNSVNIVVSPLGQSRLPNNSPRIPSNQIDPITRHQKFLLDQEQTSKVPQKSLGSENNGKSSVRSVCTSTPADASRHKKITSLCTSPSFELSPVPRSDSIFTVDNSVFESPMCFKENIVINSNELGSSPSLGSKYETCLTSNRCEGSDLLTELGSLEKLKKNNTSAVKDNITSKAKADHQSHDNCASNFKELTCKPIKEAYTPVFDVKKSSGKKSLPVKTFQKDHLVGISVTPLHDENSKDNTEMTLDLVNHTERQRKYVKRLAQRDFSPAEKSVIFIGRKDRKTVNPNLILSKTKRKCIVDAQLSKIKQSSQNIEHTQRTSELGSTCTASEELAEDEQSLILTRKSRFSPRKGIQLFEQQSPVLPRWRTSKRLERRILKNSVCNASHCQESSSSTSKIFCDNEQSVVVKNRTGRTYNKRRQSSVNVQSPVITRKRHSQRLLERKSKVPINVTHNRDQPQFQRVQTSLQRRSTRGFVTNRNAKNPKRNLSIMDFSKLSIEIANEGLGHTGDSTISIDTKPENSVSTYFKKRKPRSEQLIHCKASSVENNCNSSLNASEIYSETEEESEFCVSECVNDSLISEEKISFNFENLKQDPNKESNCSVDDFSAQEDEWKDLSSQRSIQESQGLHWKTSHRSEIDLEDANTTDNVLTKSLKPNDPPTHSGSSYDLEDECGSLPSLNVISTKPGKGWRRSFTNLATAQVPNSLNAAGQVNDDVRRQTVHRISTGLRKTSGLRMSAIPPEINHKIEMLTGAPLEEMCRLSESHRKITSFNETYRNKAPQVPSDPREHVLLLCSQEKPVPLTDCFSESRLACCKKIGEGVYGEVFMTRPNPNNLEGATVLKIMPIEGRFEVNGEPQKMFEEILSEIVISLELSNLQRPDRKKNWTENFVHMLNSWCIEGRYHHDLLHLWDVFHEEKGSENDRPDIFPDTQLYIVLEFGHGGSDLESYIFNNASNALAIAYSLAVAEEELEFEHRDLHWGNVLVSQTREAVLDFKLKEESFTLRTHGLKATVIDFTLSRMKLPHCVVYNNLAEDPSLFTAQGDYQFEIYRQMKKSNMNDWEKFTPYTNVLWLHYILDKMTSDCYYKNVKSKVHKTHMSQLNKLKQQMLDYESASDFVLKREH
ncbi:Serine/threonine-protein kinase haspin-like [Homarus americanus]|uniref:non-specific serine/threonine protein kinase n=1 Tax=Homarus americanus TaxID=6706 RepID=A0A8J5MVY6_HOMAM|nr:Serine/threonine-protein kinase haspin-like [Homarus americanus]